MNYLFWLLLLGLSSSASLAQTIFHIDSLPPQGVLLDKSWKWHSGDNLDWAKPNLDDSQWKTINPAQDINDLPQVRQAQIGWFRLRFRVNDSLKARPISLAISQLGASEIYLNGRLLHRFGKVSQKMITEQTFNPQNRPFLLPHQITDTTILAIRYSITHQNYYANFLGFGNKCLAIRASLPTTAWNRFVYNREVFDGQNAFNMGVFFLLALLHFFMYVYQPTRKANLFFSIYAFFGGLTNTADIIFLHAHLAHWQFFNALFFYFNALVSWAFLLIAVYALFQRPVGLLAKVLLISFVVYLILVFRFYNWGWVATVILNTQLVGLEIIRISFLNRRTKRNEAIILIIGQLLSIFFFIAFTVLQAQVTTKGDLNLVLEISYRLASVMMLLTQPIFISVLLGREAAQTNRLLEKKLLEIAQLSQQTLAQEQEKQQFLANQNETLERQVTEQTSELRQSLSNLQTTQTQLIQKEKMASLGELTAGIAHEIQNPLNFVNNFSELNTELMDELEAEANQGNMEEVKLLSQDIKENLTKITHHGKRASGIVKGMLEHSRTSSGQKEPTDLNMIANEYLRLASQGWRSKDKAGSPDRFTCELVTEFDTELTPIEVMPQEIGRVLLNLYNNAFYAVSQKQKIVSADYQPTITVSTSQVDGQSDRRAVEIRVKDNGTGIPDAVKAKIFQPFFTTKPTGEGTGLGLSLSYDIVTKGHEGTIEMASVEGEETTFIVSLPR